MSCPHLNIGPQKNDVTLIQRSEGTCDECNVTGPNLWACLEASCKFVGCGESKNDHGSKHYEEKKHYVAMNLKSFRVWCYACEKELILDNQFRADKMKQLKQKRNKKATPGTAHLTRKHHDRAKKSHEETTSENIPTLKFATLKSLCVLQQDGENLSQENTRGLTGLKNLGNTCYMNAALQCLSNCKPLTQFFVTSGQYFSTRQHNSMTTSYLKLLLDIWSQNKFSSVAPSSVHSTLRLINPSFKSYQQQDTQEFLRCFMDRLHEELKQPVPATHSINENTEGSGDSLSSMVQYVKMQPPPGHDDVASMSFSTSSEDSFKSCQSADVDSIPNETSQMLGKREESLSPGKQSIPNLQEWEQLHSSGYPQPQNIRTPETPVSHPETPDSPSLSLKRTLSQRSPGSFLSYPVNAALPKKAPKFHSVISDVFDGEIKSSVQCKTCLSFSHTRETFQDLSLPIPGKDETTKLHGFPQPSMNVSAGTPQSNGPCANNENYQMPLYYVWDWFKSWIWGPEVNLSDCLSAFFSADELKGDNMYSCEKCNKLRNGIKYCRILKLPEVLCIHLKRFRHEYLTSYSTKITSTVTFPLQGLDLRRYNFSEELSENTVYDLSSVIIHHGGTGGGHYTSFCKNLLNGNWYEFDDQYVTQVSESTVADAEAYVLFYSKRDDEARRFRDEVLSLDGNREPVLMKYYVSVEWMNKFLSFSNPGPIDNRRFLCSHDNLDPALVEHEDQEVCCVSEQTWRKMYERFGGGPAVTHLQPCAICLREAQVLEMRRTSEQQMYLKLSATSQDYTTASTFYVSMVWFRRWQNFIQAKEKDPPGEIDNTPIALAQDGKVFLRKGSDYGEITVDAWQYLLRTYGGGPPVPAQHSNTGDDEAMT